MAPVIDRSLRLPSSGYFPTKEQKTGIAIHHTVGGTARSTFEYWKGNQDLVGTAYIIDRPGTIFEVFDPDAWAWQFGLKWASADKIAFEQRFIGIEIASEGALIESNGSLYSFGTVSEKTRKPREEAFDYGEAYRGFQYFDKYEPAQVEALCVLLGWLCDSFNIEKQVPSKQLDYYGEGLKGFQGIIGHTMVRLDKTDPLPDSDFWTHVCQSCAVNMVDQPSSPAGSRRKLSESDISSLFESNVVVIDGMNVAAGSMVKGLIMELARNDRATYLRLRDPVPNGHAVSYDLVQGDPKLVERIAKALGFQTATASQLVVRNA